MGAQQFFSVRAQCIRSNSASRVPAPQGTSCGRVTLPAGNPGIIVLLNRTVKICYYIITEMTDKLCQTLMESSLFNLIIFLN